MPGIARAMANKEARPNVLLNLVGGQEKMLTHPLRTGLYCNSVTHTPTSRLAPGAPTNDPAIGGTDSGNLATATAM